MGHIMQNKMRPLCLGGGGSPPQWDAGSDCRQQLQQLYLSSSVTGCFQHCQGRCQE
jgi:hypothetical protein